jgi:hypothetical protein
MSTVKTQQKKDIIRIVENNNFAEMPTILKIDFSTDSVSFHLSDSRIITIPISWIPKLENAANAIREDYILRGHFVFWENIDEIIGVKNLLNGSIVPK